MRDFLGSSSGGVVQYLVCAIENGIPFCKLTIQLDFILKVKFMNTNVCKRDCKLQKVIFTTVPELGIFSFVSERDCCLQVLNLHFKKSLKKN